MFTIRQLDFIITQMPTACAQLVGGMSHPTLSGLASFYRVSSGILLIVEVTGLPILPQSCGPSIFGLHIHEGSSCTGTGSDPFANVGPHYNPEHCILPEGDLPPLYGNQGDAFMAVLLSGFTVEEILGRTVVIHSAATMPETSESEKIACGQIVNTGCNRQFS